MISCKGNNFKLLSNFYSKLLISSIMMMRFAIMTIKAFTFLATRYPSTETLTVIFTTR